MTNSVGGSVEADSLRKDFGGASYGILQCDGGQYLSGIYTCWTNVNGIPTTQIECPTDVRATFIPQKIRSLSQSPSHKYNLNKNNYLESFTRRTHSLDALMIIYISYCQLPTTNENPLAYFLLIVILLQTMSIVNSILLDLIS